jgi:transcriptional regulator with XRE-family HTH domain
MRSKKISEGAMDETEIGTTMRRRRKQLGLTLEQVAELASTHRRTIEALELGTGTRGATLGTLLAAAEVLGLVVDIRARDE